MVLGLHRWARFVGALAVGAACASTLASGVSSQSTTVAARVPSATMLTNGCTGPLASSIGTGSLAPGTGGLSATAPTDVCRITFGASNDTAQLRVGQADGVGDAMELGLMPPAVQQQGSLPGRMNGVFGYDDQLAFVAGRGGVTLRTNNGGLTYDEFNTGAGVMEDVEAIPGDPNTWFFVGVDRLVHRTTNGQATPPTYTSVMAPLTAAGWPATTDILAITIPTATTLVIVGQSGWIAKSTDAGTSWNAFQHADGAVGNITGVDALDASTMLAVSSTGRILTTTLGGDNSGEWIVSTAPGTPTPVLNDVAIGAANRAYAVGTDGTVLAWDGSTWLDRTSAADAYIDVTGVDVRPGAPDEAWAVTEEGGVLYTPDVGASWTFTASGSSSRLGDIHAGTPDDVFLTGFERTFATSADAGASWSIWSLLTTFALQGVAASPVDGKVAIAVGSRGAVRRTSTGGAPWTSTNVGTASLFGVTLANDTTGWAVGDQGTILRTTDAGANWSVQAAPAGFDERLHGVVALDAYRAVAVARDGRILTTDNGGTGWVSRASGVTRHLTSVAAHGDSIVVAVGSRGTIVRSTDAGETWTATPGGSMPDPLMNLIAVDMTSATVGYAATTTGAVWRTTDAGATWTLAGTVAPGARALGAYGSSIVVVSKGDVTSRSTDGGTSFAQTTGGTARAVGAVDTHAAYIVGNDEIIMRLDSDPTAAIQVGDWSSPARDWDAGSFFGVCLQDFAGGAVPDWIPDTMNTSQECEALDSDPWRAVPAIASTAAHTTGSGTGSVDLVWGMRVDATLSPGSYEATVSFETVSPNP